MSKRKRRQGKQLFPTKLAARYVPVYQGPNIEALKEYHQRSQTTSGPKNKIEHLPQNTFQRPIINGKVNVIYCGCGKGPFQFENDFNSHRKHVSYDKDCWQLKPEYVPESLPVHMANDEIGTLIVHSHIKTKHEVINDKGDTVIEEAELPKKLVHKRRFEIIQSTRRTKINELLHIKVGDYRLHFTPTKDKWYFIKVIDGKEIESKEYISQERAMLAYIKRSIIWK